MFLQMINRKNSKKGFTLVEVIVVLVILAILAALLIPSMTKWIDKAKDKSILVEARSALLAAQTIASEKYAKGETTWTDADSTAAQTLSGMAGTISGVTLGANNQVTALTYTNGKSVTYNGSAWSDPTTPVA